MKTFLRTVLACALLMGGSASARDVVINEIMYHPAHTAAEAEDTGREWLELFNRGTNAVSLDGWRLSKGIEFAFTNITLPPDGYLVVAANRTNFQARYPGVTNVVGDWTGRLGNTDDEIRLLDATGEEINRVAYADSGDWAVRARLSADALGLRGWDWLAPQDGEGMTLELINPSMPNRSGQNWAASAVTDGTPGAANSVFSANTAPFIQGVSHFPLVPRSTESVTVKAQITDEQADGRAVTLYYRNASSASPPAFTALAMLDDGAQGDGLPGDGLFATTIPAQANNAVIEFYVSAADQDTLNRTWPAPARNAPDLGGGVLPPESGANALYQVDDATYTGTQPFYRMIMTETERAFLASIQGSLRSSDAAAHGTFVSVDPNGMQEHHASSYRRRGAGSRGAAIPNYRVNFAADRRWKGVTSINLNSQYTHSQVAGSVLAAIAGLQAELQKPVQVRVNNANLVNLGSPQFGSYAQQEVPDGDYAKAHFPNDPNGNIYRASSAAHSATLAYLGTDPNSYIASGYAKTANGAENDWTDLINLTDVLNNAPDTNSAAAMQQRVNIQQWMIYFAVFTLLDSKETSLGIGIGDDFGMYRGQVDTRFQLLGHDFDTIFGQGDVAGNVNDSIFRATAVPAIDRFLRRPEFAPLYHRTLTNLLLTAFAPAQVSAALDQHLGSWVNPGVIAAMKSFSVSRNAGVLAQIPLALTVRHPLAVQNGYPRTIVNSVALSGAANAVETRSVLVNGAPATWSAWNAQWAAPATLRPGLNRVLVQALDASGREFERATLDVWYDRGAVVNITSDINDDSLWTAAGGPYNITVPIALQNEYTLTIEPGTTVYLAPGASLTVPGNTRLHAVGTDTQHIRFGRNPAVAGNWGSLNFLATPSDHRLAYVDFDSSGGTTIGGHHAQIHVNNSRVFLDHCTWPGTPAVSYISFNNSSFIVQHCTFPTYSGSTGPEMLHGVNGLPVGGHGIFRDNYFGHTWGFNDTIDFTGGNRPGAILQIIGNVFDGASDDHLDLDSTDAWIEGNIFMHAHRDPTRTDNALDTASAISGGVDVLGQNPDWTILNNLFYDVDHVFLNKGNSTTTGNGGGRVAFLYNTVAHVARENSGSPASEIAAFNWSDNNIAPPDPAVGSGLYAAHNILYAAPALFRFYNPANHTVIMENNILPLEFKGTTNEWTGPGSGNQYLDPRLNLGALGGIAVSNVTAAQLRQAFQLRPGSPARGAGFGGRDLGGLNPPGIAIAGEPIGTTPSTSATLTVGPGGTFNWGTNAPQPWGWNAFRWKLDDGPWSAVIPITNDPPFTNVPTITLKNLSDGPHTVYVTGRNDAGYFQDDPFVYPTNSAAAAPATASRLWTVNTNFARLVLNEILSRNVSTLLADGKYSDLIELHNAGAHAVDLGDMSLTDDPAQPRKFIFPTGTMITPGEHLVLYAAGGEATGRIYLGFSLNDTGEGVFLFDRVANGGALLDSVTFGLQLADLSIGRLADGGWGLTRPTFGAANLAQPVGAPARLRINEWFAASGEIFQQDFIELFNAEPWPVALGGLALSDAPMSTPRRSVIPALSFIAGGGWQSFRADGNATAGAAHVGFHLSADGGWLSLAQTNGAFIDIVVYGPQFPDVAQGRSPDGTANYVFLNQPTPGAGNPGQTVVITSINTNVVPLNKTWRMEASGVNLGTAWRANNYNDAGWFSGPAMFYNYDGSGGQAPPVPVSSTIPFTNPKQTTVYFRTTFNFSGPTSAVNFLLTHIIDDGCVLYLNNQEIYRYNMSAGVISYTTLASSTVSGAPAVSSGNPLPMPFLVPGTNYLALEVHQAGTSSSDLAMAIQIDSQRLVTNYLDTPIVLNEFFTKNNSFTNASGKSVDWVEFYNPTADLVDISDLSLTDDLNASRRWVFPPGATIGPNGYYVVEFDDSAAYSPFNAGFELSADSGAVYLFNRPTAGGGLLDSVVYGVQVADLTLGRATPGLNSTWTLGQPTRGAANAAVPLASAAALRINEWMPNPAGNAEDWFEIYNSGAQPVALGGLHLTDDLSNPIKHTIRPLSFIGAGPESWLKFTADNATAKGADHVNFKLANTEAIGLYTSNAVPTQITTVTYANAPNGISQGRLPDGGTNLVYFPSSASPEEANWLPLLGSVVINEALTRAAAPLEQAIELRNPGEVDVAVGGWFLSNARKDLKRFPIPAGTVVSSHGFKVFYEAQFNPNHDLPPSFALSPSKDDEVILSVADADGHLTGYRTSVKFGAAADGVSFGRHEKSTGDDFVALNTRTFGLDNPVTLDQFRTGTGADNAYPLVGPLVINEIHYHPPDNGPDDNTLDEFIEILNPSASPVLLYDPAHPTNSWRLRDAVDFDFPTNATVPANGFVLIVSFDPAMNATALTRFLTRYGLGPDTIILGPWTGKLDNSSDSIELLRPDAPVRPPSPDAGLVPYILVERVKYSDTAPWPTAADGDTNGVGVSLQRRQVTHYGNDPVNWIAGGPTPASVTGPAAGQAPTVHFPPGGLTVNAGGDASFTVGATGAAPLTYQWRGNGVILPNATNATLLLSRVQAINAGLYSVLVMNKWGASIGGPVWLSVLAPPQIAQQPQSRTVLAGADTTFIVTASGGALQYQWRLNGTNLAEATNAAFTLTNAQLENAGDYDVRVNNGLGATTSAIATLTVLVTPSLTVQPQSLSVVVGNSARFSATATGTLPLGYQWRRNGTNLPGANGASFTLNSAQPADAGGYTFVVTNVAGSITSAVATLTVIVPPTITVVASDAFAAEPGANTGRFTFTRTGSTAESLEVTFIVSGSASTGGDYLALNRAITIPAGASATSLLVTPLDDPALEGDETVLVILTGSTDYLVGNPSSATVVIHDDDNAPPVISILTPTNEQLILITPARVDLTVSTSDPDGAVTKVEFFADETNQLGESTSAPFSFTWTNAPAGSNALTARATDNLGSTTVSAPVVIILNARPAVSIVSPVNGTSFSTPATIAITAIASDADGSVTQVTFYANAALVGTDASAPFTATLSGATAGAYVLRAVAFDNRGVAATSAVVTVVVNQPGVFDDFEPDTDFSQWSAFGDAANTLANSYGGSASSSHSLWFGGDLARSAATRAMDTMLGGTIAFQLRIAGSSGGGNLWEQADLPGEGVVLEYSINAGANWVNIATFDVAGANYTQGWTPQEFLIPSGAQATATLFRWRQLTSSGGCCDHWAIDDVQILIGPTPPNIATQPAAQSAIAGGSAFFAVSVFGSAPFTYQWRFNGSNLAGATGATLTLELVSTNQAGLYSVVVSNAFGTATSAEALLSVLEANSEYFRILALTTNNVTTLEHYQLTGYENGYVRGGLGVSSAQVIVSGGTSAGRFSAANLTGGATLGTHYDALITDLRTETVYCFGTNATGPALSSSQATTLSHLLELNGNTGLLTGNAIPLSLPVTLSGAYGNYGFFSGYGRAVLCVGGRLFHIALPSGAVASLGTINNPVHNYANSWSYGGLVESAETGLSLIHVRDSRTMIRTLLPDGAITNFASFSNLNYFAAISFSVTRSRWYFDTQYGNQFTQNGTATVGFGDAQFALNGASNLPPTVVVAPQSVQALAGGRASFAVSALGDGVLGYQWRFNEADLPGAIAPGLVVLDVQPEKLGGYSVVITNSFGSVTTAPVALTIAQPPVVTSQPQSQTVLAGATVTFSVTNTGDGPFTYYWKFNGQDYTSTTNGVLVLPFANFYQNGLFSVEVRNPVGVAFSANATLVVLAPPFFTQQPIGRTTLRGMNVTLTTVVDGTRPFYLQWRKDGTDLPGATNTTLALTDAQPADSAGYALVATNIYGAVTSVVATVTVLELDPDSFAIKTLGTNNAIVQDVFPLVNYVYQNGLAASVQKVFLNGNGSSGAGFSAADLSGGFGVGAALHGVVGDLRSRKVYQLAAGTNLLTTSGGTVSSLVELDGLTGQRTTNLTALSSNITMNSYSAVFAGYGRIVLMDGNSRVYEIALPSGQVTFLGAQSYLNYLYAYGFAYRGWGIAERIGTNTWLAHVRDEQTIERVRVPDGLAETIATFSNLGDYAGNFTVSLPRQRWYFNFQGTDQFGGGANNNLVSADASFVYQTPASIAPTLLEPPASKFVLMGSSVTFSGLSEGSTPLRYQWRSSCGTLLNATNAVLTLPNVTTNQSGCTYWLEVTNLYGAVTSAVATLTVVSGISLAEAVDTAGWIWSSGGNSNWLGQALVHHDGTDAAQSGTITHSQQSWMETVLTTGPGTLTFWWKVSSESCCDALGFYTNGVLQTSILGEVGWVQRTNRIGAGVQTLRWRYNKDGSVNTGQDKGWVDQVSFSPDAAGPPVITSPPQSQVVAAGATATFSVTATGALPLRYRWLFNGTPLALATNASLVVASVQATNAGNYQVVVTNLGGSVTSVVATLSITLPPAFVQQPQSQLVPVGSAITLSVVVTGTPPFGFRWRRNGTTFLQTSLSTLTITNAQLTNSGLYTVVVTNVARPLGLLSGNAVVTVFTPPRLHSPRLGTNGGFQFSLTGDIGSNYDIEVTTDLIGWGRLTTISNVTGTVPFTETNAPPNTWRFYRARLLSP